MKLFGTAKWCKVQEPDTTYAPQWSLNLYPSVEVLKKLESMGFAVKEDTDGERFIKAKQNVTAKSGKTNEPPRVVGPDGKTKFTDLIGNGSEVNILTFEYEYKGIKYLGLKAVQVVKHVAYGDDFDDLSDGDGDFSAGEEEF